MVSAIDSALRSTGRRVIATAPRLEGPLSAARTAYVRAILDAVAWRHRRQHAAPIDPYELLWVDPDDIEYVAAEFEGPKFQRLGRVVGGDWDVPDIRFAETDIFQGFKSHFDGGVPWAETAFFERVAAGIELGRTPWGCDSRVALEERCRRLDALYDRIDREGYLSQPELLDHDGDDPMGAGRTDRLGRLIKDEISVDIGRNGELLFADGRNRLSIATLLGVDRVPALVLVRHDRWQRLRDRVATTGRKPTGLADHPDLRRLCGSDTEWDRPRSIEPWL
ncbi:hypothetical protein [Halohasta salina]|uniref:hypothetical protein n=1 Tax=Halohasta salina TaxID=2961621 RepID=UPI0020A49540|nr:hypothetical protein [Halohasta salina]